jgi:hypothetical protein
MMFEEAIGKLKDKEVENLEQLSDTKSVTLLLG